MGNRFDIIFAYQSPSEEDIAKYQAIRAAARVFAEVVCQVTPACADQSAAIRKIREAVMTANAAIALKGVS